MKHFTVKKMWLAYLGSQYYFKILKPVMIELAFHVFALLCEFVKFGANKSALLTV